MFSSYTAGAGAAAATGGREAQGVQRGVSAAGGHKTQPIIEETTHLGDCSGVFALLGKRKGDRATYITLFRVHAPPVSHPRNRAHF